MLITTSCAWVVLAGIPQSAALSAAPGGDPTAGSGKGGREEVAQTDPGGAAPAAAWDAGGRWTEVELPVGLTLELKSGAVVSRAAGDDGTLLFADGVLRAIPRLWRWERPGSERVSGRVVRGGGSPVDQPVAKEGDEFLFELADGSWGYLRVARVAGESVRLELLRADAEREALVRDPREVETRSGGADIELRWIAPRPGARYEVWRSTVGGEAPAVRVGEVDEPLFVDTDVTLGQPYEYRVLPAGDPLGWGTVLRAVASDSAPEWPIGLEKGLRIDLLSGEINGLRSHFEVAYVSESHLNLRPEPGVTFARLSKIGRSVAWTLPAPESGEYQGKLLSVQVGEDVAARLPGDVFVRMAFRRDVDGAGQPVGGGVTLRRVLDLEGTRVLPVAPDPGGQKWQRDGFVVGLDALSAEVPQPESVMVAIERELAFGSDNWEPFFLGRPGARKLQVVVSEEIQAERIGRFRFRHTYPWGARSLPSAPVRVVFGDVRDPGRRAALLDAGMAELVHEDYDRRMAARGLLEELGPDAWPRLREALEADDPELAGAARELLLASDAPQGENVVSVLMAQAQSDGLGEAPPGWLAPEVPERAIAVLRAWGRDRAYVEADPELSEWLRVLVRAEPDEGLRRLAVLLSERPPESDPVSFGRAHPRPPYPLEPPGERPVPVGFDWAEVFRGGGSDEELRADIEAATDVSEPRRALVMLEIRRALAQGGAEVRDDLELALRLCQRAASIEDQALLDAAERLVENPRSRLDAATLLMDLRAGTVGASHEVGARTRIELPAATLGDLSAQLEELKLNGASYVDVVLPQGEYVPLQGENWIDLSVPGLRLIGTPGTRIDVGLRVNEVDDVVVENLTVVSTKTAAVTVLDGSATFFGCELRGSDTGVMVQRGTCELYECDVRQNEQGRRSSWSARLAGAGSQLLGRGSLFRAGSLLAGSQTSAFLAECVLDGLERPPVQGQDRSRVLLRECLVRGEGAGIQSVPDLQLEAVVVDVAGKPLNHATGRAWVCPRHVIFLEIEDPLALPRDLSHCPLLEDR